MGFSVTLVNETCDADIVLDVPAYDFQLRYSEWAVTLTVGDTYKSQMCGMCGNFNDNPDDDLIDGDFDARSDSNPGRAWGDYWTMDWYVCAAFFYVVEQVKLKYSIFVLNA